MSDTSNTGPTLVDLSLEVLCTEVRHFLFSYFIEHPSLQILKIASA